MLNPWKVTLSHEDLFIQHYARLLGWSMLLTGYDRQQAEDLVHDAFIQFTLVRPNLSAIHSLEGYLYTILRNLHLSRVRRAAVSRTSSLSAVDYDSAEIGLQDSDPHLQFHVRGELRTICYYACLRKDASKSGSVLLLRFFHGYYPGEIAQILRSQRRAVDDLMRIARREVRLYLDNPRPLSIRGKKALAEIRNFRTEETTQAFLNELRQAIFRSRRGECLSPMQLKELYTSPESAPVDSETLAHIVSCPHCLEEVNHLLGLPPLSDRFPTDMTGPDSTPKHRTTSGGGSTEEPRRLLRQRARAVYEHQPEELHISINGFIVGSQVVNSGLSRQTLSVNTSEKISFVEVLSEQGIRLLLLNVEPPPDGRIEQHECVEMSDGRTLDLSLSFSNAWPKVCAVYRDPLLTASYETKPHDAENPVTEIQRTQRADDAETKDMALFLPSSRRLNALIDLWQSLAASGFWLRPGMLTVLGAFILIAVVTILRFSYPPVSAADLLRQAARIEETAALESDLIVHRIFSLEERHSPAGALVSRRKIEVWLNAQKGLKARRVFDENNQIVAGEWTDTDGSKTIYQRGAEGIARSEKGSPLDRDNIWRLEPSARDFSQIVADMRTSTVEERAAAYVINCRSGGEAVVVRASLTLNKADLHAIEQALVVRQGDQTREYRFIETGFEQRSVDSVAPAVFQPDPGLATVRARLEGVIHRDAAIDSPISAPTAPAERLSADALAGLQAEALYQLHRVDACLNDQVSLQRTTEGELHIQAIVETETRKRQIVEALQSVVSSAAARVEVSTVAEALKQLRLPGRPGAARTVEIRRGRFPVYADLQLYFSEQDGSYSANQVDEEVRRFASRALNRSRQALVHAWALDQLRQQLSANDLRALNAEAEAKWRSMIREHARALYQETRALRLELQPIFFEAFSESEEMLASDTSRAIKLLFEMASHHEQAIRSAFTISAEAMETPSIKTEAFWRSLCNAEKLAARIQSDD